VLVGKVVLLSGVVLVLVMAGVWTSWRTAQDVMPAKGREHGTMTVGACGEDLCTGSFVPTGAGVARPKVSIDKSSTRRTGEKLAVAVRPGTDEVVRTGWGGVLQAWVPLAGALLLASVVLAGGLRMRRTAWVSGVAGGVLLVAAFAVT